MNLKEGFKNSSYRLEKGDGMKKILLIVFGVMLFDLSLAQANEFTDKRIYQLLQNKVNRNFKNTDVEIDYWVKDQIVFMTGSVDTGAQRYVLENMPRDIVDVKGVNSKLRIRDLREKTDYSWDQNK